MNISKLMSNYKKNNPDGHFSDKETLKFFGERLSEMKVLKDEVTIEDYAGNKHSCYCVSSYQRKHPLGARKAYHYFDTETFDIIYK